jgi:hypothetical protein
MTYFFVAPEALAPFQALSDAIPAERRPLTLPNVEFGVYELVGKVAAPAAVSGADVLPWRPARGAFLLLEQGSMPPDSLIEVEGVAGAWWHAGAALHEPIRVDRRGFQLTYLFVDDDPVDVAARLAAPLAQRWSEEAVVPWLAAPFYAIVPFEWGRHLP